MFSHTYSCNVTKALTSTAEAEEKQTEYLGQNNISVYSVLETDTRRDNGTATMETRGTPPCDGGTMAVQQQSDRRPSETAAIRDSPKMEQMLPFSFATRVITGHFYPQPKAHAARKHL